MKDALPIDLFLLGLKLSKYQRIELLQWDRWGDTRTFPLAVWPAYRRCTGLHSLQKAESKSAPLIAKCRYKDTPLPPKWEG